MGYLAAHVSEPLSMLVVYCEAAAALHTWSRL